ncbi:sag-related sequence srs60a [Cystoisospora suis]|uniref:Sag-related sequence srs60a n=1 Tax=Cystoisospora suis TaxID=483139 RepID=A0A2C6KXI8_9APIC|nr:sag-related sequence srs60a [Cystoisospora suis]
MAGQQRHCRSALFFLVASVCLLCTPSLTAGLPDAEPSQDVKACEPSMPLQLELSRRNPLVQFKCGTTVSHLLPKIVGSTGTACFKDASCEGQGSLPELLNGVAEIVSKDSVYTVATSNVPVVDTTAYFLCSGDPDPKKAGEKCLVTIKIKGSAPIREDRQCTTIGSTVKIGLTAPVNEATFACGREVMALAPESPTRVFSDENCTAEADLATLIPGASLTRGTNLELHKFALSAFPQKKTTLCYKCHKSGTNDACKVIITVDAASATSTTTSPTSGARSVIAGAGVLAVVWVAAPCAGALYGTTL